jgi:hypothetical protein
MKDDIYKSDIQKMINYSIYSKLSNSKVKKRTIPLEFGKGQEGILPKGYTDPNKHVKRHLAS